MEIHQHQLPVCPRQGHIAHQQAPLQIRRGHRPGEGAGQGDALGTLQLQPADGLHAAVDLADGGQGIGHKVAGVVQCVGTGKHIVPISTEPVPVLPGLIHAVAAPGAGVHLLEKIHIRILAAQEIHDAAEIGAALCFRGLDALAAVHEKVRLSAQTGVSGVQGQDLHRVPHGHRPVLTGGFHGDVLHRRGFILPHRQPQHQGHGRQQNDPQQDQYPFSDFPCHHTVTSVSRSHTR